MEAQVILYFAYGSNMNPRRMSERGINIVKPISCSLAGYKLIFNKKAKDGAFAYANIQISCEDDFVEGILYQLSNEDIKKLDRFEGFPNHYDKKSLSVVCSDGKNVQALTYIANGNMIKNGLKPKKEYLNHLLAGKDYLSEKYYKSLSNTSTYD